MSLTLLPLDWQNHLNLGIRQMSVLLQMGVFFKAFGRMFENVYLNVEDGQPL